MARIGSVYVNLQVDIGQMTRFRTAAAEVESSGRRMRAALGSTSRSVHTLRGAMSQSFRSRLFGESLRTITRTNDEVQRLRAAFVALSAITGTGFTGALSAAYLIQTADRARLLSNQLKTVTTDYADLKSVQEALYDVSQRTRSSFDATTKIYARTARATEHLGLKQQELLRITETVQKAFAIGGATQQEATGAAIQLSQGIASDRFSGDEFRSVAENAPVLLQGMAKTMGVTIGKLREMAHAGQLTADVVTKAILQASGSIDEQFGKTVATVGQGLTRVDNAFLQYIGDVDDSYGMTRKLSEGLSNLAKNFEEVAWWMDKAALGAVSWLGGRSLGGAVRSPFASYAEGMEKAANSVDRQAKRIESIRDLTNKNTSAIRDQEKAIVDSAIKNREIYEMDKKRSTLLLERNRLAAKGASATDTEKRRIKEIDTAVKGITVSEAKRTEYAAQLSREQGRLVRLNRDAVGLAEAHTRATQGLAVAQRNATRQMILANMARRAGSGVLNFFGGWTGVALTAAIAGMAYFGRESAKAAEEVDKITRKLENMGYLTKGAADEMANFQKSIVEGRISKLQTEIQDLDKYLETRKADIAALSLVKFDPLRSPLGNDWNSIEFQKAFSEYRKVVALFRKGQKEIAKNGELSDDLRTKIERISLSNPEMASVIRQFMMLVDQIKAAIGMLDDYREGLKKASASAAIDTPAWIKDAMYQDKYMKETSFLEGQNALDKMSEFDKDVKARTEAILKAAKEAGEVISKARAEFYAKQQALGAVVRKDGLLGLIGNAEGTDKGRGYNEVLGYGAYGGKEASLVTMTLREIIALQKEIRANPNNPHNSGAVGRYQFLESTLKELIEKLGLKMSDYFTPALQDRLALERVRMRGRSAAGLRNEWEGLRGVDSETILQAYDNTAMGMPSQDEAIKAQIELKQKQKETIDKLIQSMKNEISQQELELAMQGKTEQEKIKALKLLELEQQLKAQGIEINDTLRQQLEAEAEAYAKGAVRIDQMDAAQKRLEKQQKKSAEAANQLASDMGGLFREIANGTTDWTQIAIKALGSLLTYMNQMNLGNGGQGIFGGGIFQHLIGGFLGISLPGVPAGVAALPEMAGAASMLSSATGSVGLGSLSGAASMAGKMPAPMFMEVHFVNDVDSNGNIRTFTTGIARKEAVSSTGELAKRVPQMAMKASQDSRVRRLGPSKVL